jgi:Secretion system C-terminal sorting domain
MYFLFRFSAPITENTSISMVDLSGNVLFTMNLGQRQNGSIEIPLEKLVPGMYLVQLTSGSSKVIQRLVKD